MHPSQKVVALNPQPRKLVSETDLRDITQPIGQNHYARKFMREWIVLPDEQWKLLGFIFGRTIEWGKAGEYFTYRLFANGDHASRGLGKSERPMRAALSALEKVGVIVVNRQDAATKGLFISINLEWNPEANMPSGRKRFQNGENAVAHPENTDVWEDATPVADSRTPRLQTAAPSGREQPDIKARTIQQDFSKHEGYGPVPLSRNTAPRSASLEIDPASGWESEPAARPKEISSSPVAPAPSTTTVDDLLAPLAARDQRRLEKASRVLKPGALEETFRIEFSEHFGRQPGAIFLAWTPKEMGMVKNMFVNRWTSSPEEAHAFVRWSVANWQAMMSRPCFAWMKRDRPPEFPELGFWLRHHANFLVEMGRDATDRWISDMKDFEAREFARLTVKEGMSPEAARMKIAEERAARRMREENAKAKQSARAAWQKAELALAEANRAGNRAPHPRSLAAQEARRAEDKKRLQQYREENNIKPLGENDPIPDLVAAAEIGARSAGWDKLP
ncbi:hypothetical protein [Ensifer sp.]|uniref:hypothetical protein n=1 Tax=Ensifer sp. TaxID=1872086 RepID=UPI002899B781|nr:hypothetical protein [Ensifer sp.]